MYDLTHFGAMRVLFVMAARPEYGPHLQARFSPLITGVGPVEGALHMGRTLGELATMDALPDLVISLGSAGSAHKRITDIFQITQVSYRDMDASPLGFAVGVTPFLDRPAVMDLPLRVTGIPEATLSTGANIVSGDAYDGIDADLVDMETFAILRACQEFDVPLLALRGVSDGDADLSDITDWTEYLHVIDEKLAELVDQIAGALGERPLSWSGYDAVQGPVRIG
jgi:adenosylhomocysteine nucleosidase